MTSEDQERRLSAILAADVVGFSRMMGRDEATTIDLVKRLHAEVLETAIGRHRGRVVKLMGDGLLAEFPSVVNAIACAMEMQRDVALRNASAEVDRQITYRMGISVGDVVVDGNDILGNGVNIAARLEGLAEPGGITISALARDHIGNRPGLEFQDMGLHALKNIETPMQVFRVAMGTTPGVAARVETGAQKKPSIAVLPFLNISGDPEQEYFADGMTEDLITDLSKVSGIAVTSRNSVFVFKNRAIDVQEIGRRLNVGSVLEGSVRRAGNKVRINAQLIDAASGTHLWAERYDREFTDVFALQDEMTRTIVAQLKVRLLPGEERAIASEQTRNLEAYNLYLQGRHLYHLHSVPHALQARELFRQAVELDPLYARAYSGLADCAWSLMTNHYDGASAGEIMSASTTALSLDPTLAEARASNAIALYFSGRHDEAIEKFEEAIRLDPNLYEAHYLYSYALRDSGQMAKAALMYQKAAELSPDDYRSKLLQSVMLRVTGKADEARLAANEGIERATRALEREPGIPLPASLGAATLAGLGEKERALELTRRALSIAPDDALTQYNAACVYSLVGEKDLALDTLETWFSHANGATRRWLVTDNDFDPLAGHPRFEALVAHLR